MSPIILNTNNLLDTDLKIVGSRYKWFKGDIII